MIADVEDYVGSGEVSGRDLGDVRRLLDTAEQSEARKVDLAIVLCEEIGRFPTRHRASALNLLGVLCLWRNRLKEAEAAFLQALSEPDVDEDSRIARASAHLQPRLRPAAQRRAREGREVGAALAGALRGARHRPLPRALRALLLLAPPERSRACTTPATLSANLLALNDGTPPHRRDVRAREQQADPRRLPRLAAPRRAPGDRLGRLMPLHLTDVACLEWVRQPPDRARARDDRRRRDPPVGMRRVPQEGGGLRGARAVVPPLRVADVPPDRAADRAGDQVGGHRARRSPGSWRSLRRPSERPQPAKSSDARTYVSLQNAHVTRLCSGYEVWPSGGPISFSTLIARSREQRHEKRHGPRVEDLARDADSGKHEAQRARRGRAATGGPARRGRRPRPRGARTRRGRRPGSAWRRTPIGGRELGLVPVVDQEPRRDLLRLAERSLEVARDVAVREAGDTLVEDALRSVLRMTWRRPTLPRPSTNDRGAPVETADRLLARVAAEVELRVHLDQVALDRAFAPRLDRQPLVVLQIRPEEDCRDGGAGQDLGAHPAATGGGIRPRRPSPRRRSGEAGSGARGGSR